MGQSQLSRRQLFVRSAATAVAFGLAASIQARAAKVRAEVDPEPDPKADNNLLNALRAAELDAVATYTAGAGLIDADTATPQATRDTVKKVAIHFAGQHAAHAAALAKLIEAEGGTPVSDSGEAKLPASFPGASATTVDVLKLAADKEKGAAIAYVNTLKSISTQTAAKLVGAIGGVETQHFVVLYLLVEGLAGATDATSSMAELVVPAAFVADVGAGDNTSLEKFAALDDLLALD
jgi:rubrerythrin